MNRILTFVYGVGSYAIALLTFVYMAGFLGNFVVKKSIDSPGEGSLGTALWIDLGLLSLFSVQHSVMARPWFKRMLTSVVPVAMERSTYVLASSLAMLLLLVEWRPIGVTIWNVEDTLGMVLIYGGYAFGWTLLLFTTFLLNHFDLFGLRQVWRNLFQEPQTYLSFSTPFLYRMVRHPLYIGWLCIFWFTPVMTVAHLVFALGSTVYIFIAIQFEERDLMAVHPEYAAYRRQVPMIVPGL